MQNSSGTSRLSLRALRPLRFKISGFTNAAFNRRVRKIAEETGSRGNDKQNNSGTFTLSLRALRPLRFKISGFTNAAFNRRVRQDRKEQCWEGITCRIIQAMAAHGVSS